VGAYVVRRVASAVVLLFALSLVTYAIYFKIPSDPGLYIIGNPHPTPAQIQAANHKLGVDRPVIVQYLSFVDRLLHGNLGKSYATGEPVLSIIKEDAPVTASVVFGGAVLLLLTAIALGIVSAQRGHSRLDWVISTLPLLGIALHPLAVGLILRSAFSKHLQVAPGGGYCSLLGGGGCSGVEHWSSHLILPWVTFALFLLPLYARMVRTRVLETLDEPHVMVARGKGATERRVIGLHVMPLVLPSLAAMLAMDAGAALTAAIYIEVAFGLPGLGQTALFAQQGFVGFDLPVITGIVMAIAATVIALNAIADIIAVRLDPRLEIGRGVTGLR
jgi:peptide/nickel transport system permease protein